MFGNRNYSRYSLSPKSGDDPFSLGEAVRVNKLKDSQLSVYFNALKHVRSSKYEIAKSKNHFEDFKKAINSKRVDGVPSKSFPPKDIDKDVFDVFVKKYRIRSIKKKDEPESKPTMKRAPLKTIKTIGIEVPAVYKEQAIYALPKKKNVEVFVEIAKPVRRKEPQKNAVTFIDSEPKKTSQTIIEQHLKETKNEIDVATNQLEQIKSLLSQRKSTLSPVTEEFEDMEEKANMVRELVDKKCSPIQPRTQWTVKSYDADRTSQAKKNRLMSTLTNLNQRLQRIQEKYFNEPKIKYKSISDFIPPRSKETIETLYRNDDYRKDSGVATSIPIVEEKQSSSYERDAYAYMHQLIKRTQKLTTVNTKKKRRQPEVPKTEDSVLVLMPPKLDDFKDSGQLVTRTKDTDTGNFIDKGILKKTTQSTDMFDTVLEAPMLQDSICKSNYLMKEFNLSSSDKGFDLSVLLPKNDMSTSTEHFKKIVRFSQSSRKIDSSKDTRLHSNIDLALKNSLFYHGRKNKSK